MKLTCIPKKQRGGQTYELYLNGLNIDYLTSSKYSGGDPRLAVAATKISAVCESVGGDAKKAYEHYRRHPDRLPEGVVLGFIRD